MKFAQKQTNCAKLSYFTQNLTNLKYIAKDF